MSAVTSTSRSAEAFGGIGSAIVVAALSIFAILALEFGNFKSSLV